MGGAFFQNARARGEATGDFDLLLLALGIAKDHLARKLEALLGQAFEIGLPRGCGNVEGFTEPQLEFATDGGVPDVRRACKKAGTLIHRLRSEERRVGKE